MSRRTDEPANDNGPKNVVPLKDRLSWSPEEAAAMTGLGLSTIKIATYSGSLVARKNGKNTVILPEDLKSWLKALPRMDKNTTNEIGMLA
jgi:hypothetical protein